MAEGFLTEESLSVLLVPDVLLHNVLFHALGLLDADPGGFEDAVHLRPEANVFGNRVAGTLILHLPEHLLVDLAV